MTSRSRSTLPASPSSLPAGVVVVAGMVALLAGGCQTASPIADQSEKQLKRSLIEAAERELEDTKGQPLPVVTDRDDGIQRLELRDDIRDELELMAGPKAYGDQVPALGVDLTGRAVRTVSINLERVIRGVIEQNVQIQFARLQPAISEAQLQAAEAAFDWTLVANTNYSAQDSPRVSTQGSTIFAEEAQTVSGSVALRRQLIGGGRFAIQNDASYNDNSVPGINQRPNPANQTSLSLQWDQPLLRNFGSDVAKAEVRLARNQQRVSIQQLRRDLLRTSTEAERTYWQLVRSYRDLMVVQNLLRRGEEVQAQVKARVDIDANSAQVADATARVERRRSDLLRAQTQMRIVSDQLKVLINDPNLPVGSEVVLIPSDDAQDAPIKFNLAESVRTAIQNRPEVQQAILSIDDASIRQLVADNARLPDLSLRLQTRFSALDDSMGEAYVSLLDGSYIDYVAGLSFEMPIGNRRPEAEFRRRRLERMQSVLSYRNTVQQIVNEVKAALNRVVLNYSLIGQTNLSRLAASEALRVLQVDKEQGGGYTIERLNIELNNQEQVAAAEREEIEALTEYNSALADLFLSMGTALERNNIEFVVPTTDDELSAAARNAGEERPAVDE
jgi:outer membrane protein TolC